MARTKKVKQKFTKRRVRFLKLDYYRNVCTGTVTPVVGIDNYNCEQNTIMIWYTSGLQKIYHVNEGEKQLSEVVKIINAYIGGTGDGSQQ